MPYGIVANVKKTDRALRTGARLWIIMTNGFGERVLVSGISRGGRTIEKYVAVKSLENLRPAWVPDPMRERICFMGDRDYVQAEIDRLTFVATSGERGSL